MQRRSWKMLGIGIGATAIVVGGAALLSTGAVTSSDGSESSAPGTSGSQAGDAGAIDAPGAVQQAGDFAAALPAYEACREWLNHDGNLRGKINWPSVSALKPRESDGGWIFTGQVATTKSETLTFTCGLKEADGEWQVLVQKRAYDGQLARTPDTV